MLVQGVPQEVIVEPEGDESGELEGPREVRGNSVKHLCFKTFALTVVDDGDATNRWRHVRITLLLTEVVDYPVLGWAFAGDARVEEAHRVLSFTSTASLQGPAQPPVAPHSVA